MSDGDVEHDIRESYSIVNTVFGAIWLMLVRRQQRNALKNQISKEILSFPKETAYKCCQKQQALFLSNTRKKGNSDLLISGKTCSCHLLQLRFFNISS